MRTIDLNVTRFAPFTNIDPSIISFYMYIYIVLRIDCVLYVCVCVYNMCVCVSQRCMTSDGENTYIL